MPEQSVEERIEILEDEMNGRNGVVARICRKIDAISLQLKWLIGICVFVATAVAGLLVAVLSGGVS